MSTEDARPVSSRDLLNEIERYLSRVADLVHEIRITNALMFEIAQTASELLRLPTPDTFLGRRTHEPFTMRED